MDGKVREGEKKERTGVLRGVSVKKRKEYLKKNIGRDVTVVLDSGSRDGFYKGVSENYITVLIENLSGKANRYCVKLESIEGEGMAGKII